MWFDRDLTIAGRVIIWKKRDGGVSYAHNEQRRYTGIGYPPTLAIYLDRLVKKNSVAQYLIRVTICNHADPTG